MEAYVSIRDDLSTVREARWEEMDLQRGEWTIPPERMKNRREHRVPLAERAEEILAEAKENAVGSEWVLLSPRGLQLKDFDFSRRRWPSDRLRQRLVGEFKRRGFAAST